jgi:putative thiamine transport system substrate-binding protein
MQKEALLPCCTPVYLRDYALPLLSLLPTPILPTPMILPICKRRQRGKPVYFNAWGGDAKINSYISWAGQILADRHDITLVHVKLTDTASAVSRILAEKAAGRENGGSIDLLWVNGENFAAMKRAGLLQNRSWVTSLPNWRYTDSKALPAILSDFAEPTNGKESPWGRAQLVFSYDSARLQTPPKSAAALADYIAANPGRFYLSATTRFHWHVLSQTDFD